ncbi:ABC transporter ATP-binding protein [Sorangium cellulosum]|uniref:ABC transporter ATP-binding protein n=1 Tax=Sorangium cellulosum TaxID=56 RepID=UPI003D9A882F
MRAAGSPHPVRFDAGVGCAAAVELCGAQQTLRRGGAGGAVTLKLPDLRLREGEQVCVVGPSGAGKTTLLHVLAGLLVPEAGRVLVGGIDLARLREAERDRFRARNIGYVLQSLHLVASLSVLENVLLPLGFAGIPRRAARARAGELLERLELSPLGDAQPGSLSLGERQRAAIARAVACRPRLLLADEPTASLDEARAGVAARLLREAAAESAANLVLVTHDDRIGAGFERVLHMVGGPEGPTR